MITVCPRTLDRNVLFFHLLKLHPEYAEEKDLVNKVGRILSTHALDDQISSRKVPRSVTKKTIKSLFCI